MIWPYIILHVGFSLYGAWVVISTTFGYISLLDMSLGTAFIRLVANRSNDRYLEEVNGAAGLLVLYYLALGALLAVVAIPLAPWIGRVAFHIPATELPVWRGLVIASTILFVANAIGGLFNLVLTGLQYISESSGIYVVTWVASSLAILVTLYFGASVWALVIGAGVATSLNAVLTYWLVRSRLRGFRWLFQGWSLDFLRKNWRFSVGLQVTRVVDIVNNELDTVLIGVLTGTRFVTYYSIGMTLAGLPKDLTAGVVTSYFPEAASRAGREDSEGSERLYWGTLQLLLLVTGFVAGGVAVSAPYFIPVWFQRTVPYAPLVAALMAIANAAHQSTAPGTSYLWARGKSGWASLYGVIGAAINVALTVILALRFGFIGVVWGTSIGLTIGSLIFFVYFHRLFLQGGARALELIGKVAASIAGGAIAAELAIRAAPQFGPAVWRAAERFLVGGTVYSIVFLALAVSLSLVSYRSGLQMIKQAGQWVTTRSRVGI